MTIRQETERRPGARAGWTEIATPADVRALAGPGLLADSTWRRGPLCVRSSLVVADLPQADPPETGPTWHVSVTYQPMIAGRREPQRCDERDLRRVRRDFGMREAEEDNHHPGNARHLFLVVDPARRVACECKVDEVQMREPDGYAWSNAPEAAACRGCEIAKLTGRPCPVHTHTMLAIATLAKRGTP